MAGSLRTSHGACCGPGAITSHAVAIAAAVALLLLLLMLLLLLLLLDSDLGRPVTGRRAGRRKTLHASPPGPRGIRGQSIPVGRRPPSLPRPC
jgi:hypothetical protein